MAEATCRMAVARRNGKPAARMADEVRRALAATPPSLPSKYFYDDRGSALFEAITRLPEYYQTRTEEALLETIADAVIARTRPAEIVELGSGAGRKIRLLLDATERAGRASSLTMFDINEQVVSDSVQRLARRYPALDVRGVVGDFTEDLAALGPGGGRLGVFFAGTIGNLHPGDVPPFLSRMSLQLAPGDAFLVGVDLVKDPARLEAAYNDSAGVTAEFNLNILRHVNHALEADFDIARFEHVAFYDAERAWIEMRLRARSPSHVRIPRAGVERIFRRGDEIRTEISCKYSGSTFRALLGGTGLALEAWFTDPERLFALALLRRMPR